MQIYIEENYEKMSQKAAEIIAEKIKSNPALILGLATGSTPIRTYEILAEKYKKGELDFSRIKTFNLDDYLGLDFNDPQSYHQFMRKNFFSKINIDLKNAFFPNDFGSDYEKYENKIKESGGIDLQVVGIGRNGHIGFNEPGSAFDFYTREVELDETTIKDNSRFFDDISQVPKRAATMGIATIMNAKQILLLANGENKKEIIYQALKGPITEKVPASILQKHQNVIVVLDNEAGEKIKT